MIVTQKTFCSGPCGRAKRVEVGKIEKCPDCPGTFSAATRMSLSRALRIMEVCKYSDLSGDYRGYTPEEVEEARAIKKAYVVGLVGPVTDVMETK